MPSTIFLIGWRSDSKDVEKLLDLLYARAGEAFAKLDWQNPQSEVSRLNAQAGGGPMRVSPEVIAAFEAYLKVAKWSGGAFDAAYVGSGSYRDVKVNSGAQTVELTRPGMQIRFDMMMAGFLADLLIRYIHSSNMRNAMVKVGSVFRGMGQSMRGPWRIQVQDDAGTFARHAVNLTVFNNGVATVSASEYRGAPPIDPRSKSPISPLIKGVVVITREAALAQGLAQAAFILGAKKGMDMLTKVGTKALIVDMNGRFIRSPGFK